MNCFFALNTLKGRVFNHVSFCLYSERLLIISNDVKGSPANKTIGAFGLHTRWYCSHRGSNGMIMSHLQAVVPYGKSHITQSTLPSGIRFIPSRQSSLYILFSSIMLCYFVNLSVQPFYGCFAFIPFLPHKPCVADCTTATIAHCSELAVLCAQHSL